MDIAQRIDQNVRRSIGDLVVQLAAAEAEKAALSEEILRLRALVSEDQRLPKPMPAVPAEDAIAAGDGVQRGRRA